MKVITYQLAYDTARQVSLCADCERDYEYPLGTVLHGRHEGECQGDRCQRQPWIPQVNDLVEAGKPGTEDHDLGVVLRIDGRGIYVGWDSGVRTYAEPGELRPRSA